jgi:hypothetical protein
MPCDQVQTFKVDWGQKADRSVFARALTAAGWHVEQFAERTADGQLKVTGVVRAYAPAGGSLVLDADGLRLIGPRNDAAGIARLYQRQLVTEQAARAGFRVAWTRDAATGRETARLNRARGGF